MKLKVCGMRDATNIRALLEVKPDYVGMIFYPKSSRYVQQTPNVDFGQALKVGVFVNATVEEIDEKVKGFGLDLLQLHGNESLAMVSLLKSKGYRLMKVFSVSDELPIEEMKEYEPYVDYFLFDTKTPGYGGSGQKFDWAILKQYDLSKPFFLSGGIDLEDLDQIKQMNLKHLHAIDVNSRFELAPALKDIDKIKALKAKL